MRKIFAKGRSSVWATQLPTNGNQIKKENRTEMYKLNKTNMKRYKKEEKTQYIFYKGHIHQMLAQPLMWTIMHAGKHDWSTLYDHRPKSCAGKRTSFGNNLETEANILKLTANDHTLSKRLQEEL